MVGTGRRLEKRKNTHDVFWTVVNTITGKTTMVNDVPINALKENEADHLIVLFKAGWLSPEQSSSQFAVPS